MPVNQEKCTPYRVAIITAMLSGAGGGAPRSAAVQAGALSACGMDVTLYTGHSRKYPLTPAQFPLHDTRIYSCRTLGPPALGVNIGSFINLNRQAHDIDVMHVNMGWNLNTFIASRIARCYRIPYIYSLRSHMGAYHFRRYRYLKPILYRLIEKRNIRDAAAIHVTSDWEAETSAPVIQGQRVIKIPNAVDLSDLEHPVPRAVARKHLGVPPGGFHIVCFGRLGTQKNPLFLLNTFLNANLPPDVHLHFVGPPEQAIKQQLVKRLTGHPRHAQVHFVDFAKGHDRRCWLACGDLFALPSHDENFCIAAIEAVASGTFALISPHVGAIEYLPASTLRIVPLDPAAWRHALEELVTERKGQCIPDPEIFSVFAPSRVADQWLKAYKEIVAR